MILSPTSKIGRHQNVVTNITVTCGNPFLIETILIPIILLGPFQKMTFAQFPEFRFFVQNSQIWVQFMPYFYLRRLLSGNQGMTKSGCAPSFSSLFTSSGLGFLPFPPNLYALPTASTRSRLS